MKNTKCIATPGSGKTYTCIQYIKNLFKLKLIKKKTEILVIVFSNATREDFIARLIKDDVDISDQQVVTFHSISGSICTKFQQQKTKFIQLVIDQANKVLRNDNIDIRSVSKLKLVKHIFVDEAQDMSQQQYDLVIGLQNSLQVPIFMVGDPKQAIYRFQGSDSQYLINFQADDIITLNNNYRSQQNIVALLNSLSDIHINCQKPIDNPSIPTLFVYDYDNIIKSIKEIIIQSLELKHTIAIIGSVKQGKQGNMGLQAIRNELDQFEYNVLYSLGKDAVNMNKSKQIDNSKVTLSTIHQSKGLEFDVVIILDFHFQYQNTVPSNDGIEDMNNLYYVALSRSIRNLFLCCSVKNNFIQQINPIYHQIKQHLQLETNQSDDVLSQVLANNYQYRDTFNKIKWAVKELANEVSNDYYIKYKVNSLQCECIQPMQQEGIQLDEKYSDFTMLTGMFQESLIYYYMYGQKYIDNLIEQENMTHYELTYDNYFNLRENGFDGIIHDFATLKALYYIINDNEKFKFLINKIKQGYSITFVFASEHIIDRVGTINQQLIDILNNKEQSDEYKLFMYMFQKFQYTMYAFHLIKEGYQEVFDLLTESFDITKQYAEYLISIQYDGKYEYQKRAYNDHIPSVTGSIDLISDKYLIELKYQKQLNIQDYLQLFLYGILVDPQDKLQKCLFNIKTGEFIRMDLTIEDKSVLLIKILQYVKLKIHNGIIAFDLETTGLDTSNCHITDRSFKDFNLNIILSQGIVKTKHPISEFISNLTGITQQMVNNGNDIKMFIQDMKTIKSLYCKHCQHCKLIMTAYNGDSFDFKILKRIHTDMQYDINYVDCKQFISMNCNKAKNKKLITFYNQQVDKDYIQQHRAHSDVDMIGGLFSKLNINYDKLKSQPG